MRKAVLFTSILFFLISANLGCTVDRSLSYFLRQLAEEKIRPLTKEPLIIEAVEEADKEATKSEATILELDEIWKTKGIKESWIAGLANNTCSNYLKEVAGREKGLFAEIFVMDKQGCIVGLSNMTSDYWQGDEDKFTKVFPVLGAGQLFIDEPLFDASTQRYLVQISMVIVEPHTKEPIGTITVGVDIDMLAESLF